MKIKILAIVLLVFLFVGMQQVFGEAPGGGTPPAGDCPCVDVGEIVSEGGWYETEFLHYYVTETYIGDCMVRVDWYRNEVWFMAYNQAGGCTCACDEPVPEPIWE